MNGINQEELAALKKKIRELEVKIDSYNLDTLWEKADGLRAEIDGYNLETLWEKTDTLRTEIDAYKLGTLWEKTNTLRTEIDGYKLGTLWEKANGLGVEMNTIHEDYGAAKSLHVDQEKYLHINASGEHPGVKVNQQAPQLFDVNNSQLHVTADGKVGIGTGAPNDRLTVNGGDIKIEGGRYRRLKIVSDKYWAGIELVARQKGEAGHPHIDFTHGELHSPNYGIRLFAPDNDKFVIQGGNVGIGTKAPDDRLTVNNGDIKIEGGRYRRLKIVSDKYWAGIELVARQKGEAGHPHIDFTHGELHSPNYGIRLFAPDNNKFVIEGGNVGIGTRSPAQKLHVVGHRIRLTKGSNSKHYLDLRADGSLLDIEASKNLYINNNGNKVYIRNLSYTTIKQASSRKLKQNIASLSTVEATSILDGLSPVKFSYRDDSQKKTHLGFIAEDVPALIATSDRKEISPMNIIAVLCGVVPEQQQKISALQRDVKGLNGSVK